MTEPAASDTFVANFRASAPYIHAHRGRTFVVVVGGEAFGAPGLRPMLHDVALLLSLGVRVVLVAGARPQIDAGIARRGHRSHYAGGLRVTDEIALECVKEAAGTNRVELEALLSMGLPSSPMAGASVRVAAGNFVTARPIGVVDGVDFQHSGKVRRVDAEGIRQRLDSGALVVLTPIGYSATGEVFNLSTPELAAETHQDLTRLYGEAFARSRAEGSLVEALYPGAADTVHALDDAGDLLGVATGKSRRGLTATLAHHGLSDRFVTLQTSDLAPGKPQPDMALRAMAETGADPQRTVMIGDTTYDMMMARNAGIAAIGVAWGYHGVADLEAAGASAIVESFDALTGAIDALIGER